MNISEFNHSYIGSLYISLHIGTDISVGVTPKLRQSQRAMCSYNFDITPSVNIKLHLFPNLLH